MAKGPWSGYSILSRKLLASGTGWGSWKQETRASMQRPSKITAPRTKLR